VGYTITPEKRLKLLSALVDGNSERGAARIAEIDRETAGRYALLLGTAAQHLHNARSFGLSTPKIEQDEIWSYVGKKQRRVTPAEHTAGYGEAYTFVSLAMPSRFVITWTVGKRDQDTANAFEADTRARVVLMPEVNTDGLAAYPVAIGTHFGPGVDYAQVIKTYSRGGRKDDDVNARAIRGLWGSCRPACAMAIRSPEPPPEAPYAHRPRERGATGRSGGQESAGATRSHAQAHAGTACAEHGEDGEDATLPEASTVARSPARWASRSTRLSLTVVMAIK
jgi:hypothetical protein